MRGLLNEDCQNICWFNSILQCLLYTPKLVNTWYKKPELINNTKRNKLFTSLITEMWKSDETDGIKSIIFLNEFKTFCNFFTIGEQCDAHECLMFLLDMLHEETKHPVFNSTESFTCDMDTKTRNEWYKMNKNEHSLISQIFRGTTKSSIIYSQGSNVKTSNKYDYFNCITISGLNDIESLEQGIEEYISQVPIEFEKKYAFQKISIEQSPHVFIFHLARFNNDGTKINKSIQIPEKIMQTYELYAVCCHVGSYNGGHYFSFVKYNNKWYLKDDETVTETSLSTHNAYILFYKKINVA